MQWKLARKIPVLNSIKAVRSYSDNLEQSGFPVDATLWIVISLAVSAVATLAFFMFFPKIPHIAAVLSIVVLDVMLGYPYLRAMQRISAIEETLPDALKQMADTLKAGGTYEYALREVAMSEYGALKKEMDTVLRKLEEGENFENSLRTLSDNVNSQLVRRTVTIITDAVHSGAGLADILDQISEDVRAMHRISRERKSRTMMQVLFMVAAGAIVAPMIFGFVGTILNMLIGASTGAVEVAKQEAAKKAAGTISSAIQIYIFIEIVATSIMMSLMREGNMNKSIIYFPILLLVAYVVYLVSQVLSGLMVGGVGA